MKEEKEKVFVFTGSLITKYLDKHQEELNQVFEKLIEQKIHVVFLVKKIDQFCIKIPQAKIRFRGVSLLRCYEKSKKITVSDLDELFKIICKADRKNIVMISDERPDSSAARRRQIEFVLVKRADGLEDNRYQEVEQLSKLLPALKL